MTTTRPKRKSKLTYQRQPFGEFDWRTTFAFSNKYYRFDTEQDYLDSLSDTHKKNYLENRAKRVAKWETHKMRQRALRVTKKRMDTEDRKLRELKAKRFKAMSLNNTEIPAEVIALITINCYL